MGNAFLSVFQGSFTAVFSIASFCTPRRILVWRQIPQANRSGRVERTLLSAAVDVALFDLESRENKCSEIPFPSTQFFHHTQPVTAITDIPPAMRENEDGSAQAKVYPSPETDFDAAPKPLPALFDNLNNT